MARLNICLKTAELQAMQYDGRTDECRTKVIQLLKDGYAARPFLTFVASLLEPPVRQRGAPKRPPKRWLDIANDYEEIRQDISHQEALMDLAEKYECSERTVERALSVYRDAMAWREDDK